MIEPGGVDPVTITFRLPKTLKRLVFSKARERGLSVTAFVGLSLERELRGEAPEWWRAGAHEGKYDGLRGAPARASASSAKGSVTVTVRFSRTLAGSLEQAARQRLMTKTRLLREALENHVLVEPPAWWLKWRAQKKSGSDGAGTRREVRVGMI